MHATGKTKPKRRRLAEALLLDATVLTSGDATGPLVVNQLIDELQARGATNVRRPRCARCGNVKPVPYRADGQYVCRNCASKQRCANCGRISHAWYRDRNGQPRCRTCRPDPDTADPVADICTIVTRVDPDLEPTSGTASRARDRSPQAPIAAALLGTRHPPRVAHRPRRRRLPAHHRPDRGAPTSWFPQGQSTSLSTVRPHPSTDQTHRRRASLQHLLLGDDGRDLRPVPSTTASRRARSEPRTVVPLLLGEPSDEPRDVRWVRATPRGKRTRTGRTAIL